MNLAKMTTFIVARVLLPHVVQAWICQMLSLNFAKGITRNDQTTQKRRTYQGLGGWGHQMTTDCELLELAARAAGMRGAWDPFRLQFRLYTDNQEMFLGEAWNPLTDDGDALRLAVKLKLTIEHFPKAYIPFVCVGSANHSNEYGTDEFAATRRAIVRAAAEIGKSMT